MLKVSFILIIGLCAFTYGASISKEENDGRIYEIDEHGEHLHKKGIKLDEIRHRIREKINHKKGITTRNPNSQTATTFQFTVPVFPTFPSTPTPTTTSTTTTTTTPTTTTTTTTPTTTTTTPTTTTTTPTTTTTTPTTTTTTPTTTTTTPTTTTTTPTTTTTMAG